MSDASGPTISDLFISRLELGSRICALQAEKMARQREGFGADILLLDRHRATSGDGTAADKAAWSEVGRRADGARAEVAKLDIILGALEAEVAAIDREIADRASQH